MNTSIINKTFWLRTAAIFMMVMMVLSAMPIQPAHAAAAGFSAPTVYSNSQIQNAGNAFASDDVYAQTNGNNKSAVYGNFGFNIPAGSYINLVEVSVEGHGTKNWKVSVSNNGGASYSAAQTAVNSANDAVTTLGGRGTLWGLSNWTASSFTNANFKVKISSAPGGGNTKTAYLDQLMVRVIYTPVNAVPALLVVTSLGAGTYGGTANFQATLTTALEGTPLSGKTISFALDGFTRGTAVTNASGVATLNNVTLTTGLSNTTLNVGTYTLSAEFLGDNTYGFSSDTKTQVVNALPITVTANAQGKVYGSADPALTYTSTPSLVGTDTFSGALARTPGEAIGTYTINQGNLTLSSNYTLTFNGANFSITPLGITITADNKAVHVGNTDPTFTYGVSRFAGSDTFITPPTCTVSPVHTNVGTYPIVCSGANAGPNYTITYNPGTLTVTNKFVLDVVANPKTITYGDASPTFDYSWSGFVGGDTDIAGTHPTCSITGPHTDAGVYHNIVCAGGSDVKYDFNYTSGIFTVNPKPVTVTANAQSKTYGDADPALTYGFAPALIAGDSFTGALARNPGENVNTYPIIQNTLALGPNYAITYVGANLTIGQASLAVIADDQILGFGMADPTFTFTYEGFLLGDTGTAIDTPPTCSVAGAHSALGSYPITCSGGVDNNYTFTYADGTLTVVQNQVETYIGGLWQATYPLAPSQSTRISYPLDNGPVKVASTYGSPIIASERINLKANTSFNSYSEVMGLPASKLSDTYTFPWYNNTGFLDSQIRFGNVGNTSTTVTIKIGGVAQGTPYTLAPNESARVSFAGVDNGPVEVKSSNGVPIIAALRINLKVSSPYTSYSEFLGLSSNATPSTHYSFPWYNNTGLLDSQLRFANVGNAQTTVTIKIGGVAQATTYTLAPNQSQRISYTNLDSGPVEVSSSNGVPITAAMRINLKSNTTFTSYTELMGMTGATLADNRFLFPWYNNTGSLDSQLRFANVGSAPTVVSIKINGVVQPATYTLKPNESTRVSLAGVDAGPVEVYSSGGIPIIAALRINLKATPTYDSYYEFMGSSVGSPLGLPGNQLSSTYWFPWYNNTGLLDSQLRFGIP